jgi:WD40 repeat protein/serine/threonine protein kinase
VPNHSTDEELLALSAGQLRDGEMARVSDHLAVCPECCRRIDKLGADNDSLLTRLKQDAAGRNDVLVPPAQRRSAVRALRHSQEPGPADRENNSEFAPVLVPPPRQVGDYEILEEVGRGGMGVVYKSRHCHLQRLTALKMVLAGEFASSTQQLRFRLEAELAARVRHPNIVQLYEIGSYDGRPFLALEWIEGSSLADRLDGRPWAPGEAAALVETLARAIHVAHCEGVVHRDLKPANILLQIANCKLQIDDTDSAICNLQSAIPKITDFGLAQPTDGGKTLTQSGILVGTPGYMAPEQTGGHRALVGPATDVYALGVVLYELLTGQLPFRGESTLEVLRAVTSDEPPRPRRLQPRLPRDLEAITLLCLEKDPRRRYPSAEALADDLRRFQEGRQVAARPVGAVARLARACRRRPLVTSLLALLTVSLVGGLAGVTWKWLEANEQRDRADLEARQAVSEKQVAQRETYRARIAAAGAALQNNDVADAGRQLDAAPADLRGWEWRHLSSRLDDSSRAFQLPEGNAGLVLGASERLRAWSVSKDGLCITDLENGEQRTLPIVPERVHFVTVAQTRRGLLVVALVEQSRIDLLDETGRTLCRMEVPDANRPELVAISPDGTRLACRRGEGEWDRLLVFDTSSGKRASVCEGHRDNVWALAFSPDGTRLVSGGEDGTARVWDVATGKLLATCQGHSSKVIGVAFSPDGLRVVTASGDATVRQWEAATGREVEPPYDRHSGEVAAATYSPDGRFIASAGNDRTVRIWRATGRQDVAVLLGHTGAVVGVAFDANGRRLASVSSKPQLGWTGDDTARVWDMDPGATLPVLHGHSRSVYPVVYSPDGRWLASGGWDATMRLWDAMTGEPCAALRHPGTVYDLAYAPDGTWLVSASDGDNRLRIWDAGTGRVRREIQVSGSNFREALSLRPDGKRMAVTVHESGENHVRVFDVASGERLFSAAGKCLAYSPDGRWLAVLTPDEKTVLLLDAQTHETVARFSGHRKLIFKAAFCPDGRTLASCSLDRTIRLWSIDTGACRVLRGHTDEVFAVAFHPDGRRLASGGRDRAVWLWDLESGEAVARLPGHTGFVWSLAFSPDGSTLASGSGDDTVRLWDTAPLKVRYDARRAATSLRPETERLVEHLWRPGNEPGDVAEAIRSDKTLTEKLRHAALRSVLRRATQPTIAPAK